MSKRVEDPRFAHIHRDTRFKSMAKKDKKVLLDKRFKGLLKSTKFSTKPKFNQYGDLVEQEEREFDDHYEVEIQDDEDLREQDEEEQEEEFDEQVEIEDEEDDEDEDEEDLIDEQPDNWEQEEDKQAPIMEDATYRMALQNYDWQIISARDLMVLFNSFVPTGGAIKRVSVYQSNFGKEKMKEEEEFGPRSIFKKQPTQAESKEKKKKSSTMQEINQLIVKGGQDNLDIDPERLRQYERDRFRYYYAVIECDSPKTADGIYQNCNGQEFELSNLRIDLRFVPDEMKFTDKPNQECDTITQLPGTKSILSRAIGHTDVKLTWDEHIPKTNFWVGKTEEELDKVDWAEYIGDLDQDIEQAEEMRAKLFGGELEVSDWKKAFDKKRKKKTRDFDLEITFGQGFNEGGNAILERETKRPKKSCMAQNVEPEDFFVGFEDDVPKKGFKERKQERKEQLRQKRTEKSKVQLKQKEELELLVDRDQKKEERTFNANDRRFQAVYENPDYAIDPTDRHFSEDRMGTMFQEQVRRKKLKKN